MKTTTLYSANLDTFYLKYRFWDIWIQGFNGLNLTFDFWPLEVTWDQKYSNHLKAHNDFLSNFQWHFLSRTVFEIFDFKVFRVWPWPLTIRGHLKSKIFLPFESPYLTSYLTSIDTFSLYRTVFVIFDFKVFRVWPLTFRGHPRSKIFSQFESLYMTSYWTSIDTFSLSRTVFEIFDFKVFRVWPWPLTFRGHMKSKIFPPFEIPYMTSYLTSIDTFSLSRTVFEIFDFKVFRVWPWPLTFRVHLESKIFPLFESPYLTSYLTSIDTFSLSRTVFEIFDFKVFRAWPWPLTYRSHLKSKIFPLFESPYLTSYITSIDTFSLSRTVFEIFDFKVFRVWPWPLTFRGHPRSKIFSPFESPYMTSYLTYINTFSLSRTVFEIFDFKVFTVWPWPLTFDLKGSPEVKNIFTIRKPIFDFLSNFHWHFLSFSYRFWDIRLQSF